jgi:hypothetical protein
MMGTFVGNEFIVIEYPNACLNFNGIDLYGMQLAKYCI